MAHRTARSKFSASATPGRACEVLFGWGFKAVALGLICLRHRGSTPYRSIPNLRCGIDPELCWTSCSGRKPCGSCCECRKHDPPLIMMSGAMEISTSVEAENSQPNRLLSAHPVQAPPDSVEHIGAQLFISVLSQSSLNPACWPRSRLPPLPENLHWAQMGVLIVATGTDVSPFYGMASLFRICGLFNG